VIPYLVTGKILKSSNTRKRTNRQLLIPAVGGSCLLATFPYALDAPRQGLRRFSAAEIRSKKANEKPTYLSPMW